MKFYFDMDFWGWQDLYEVTRTKLNRWEKRASADKPW